MNLILKYSHFFFFSSRRRHTRSYGDWSADVCSSDLDLFRPEGTHEAGQVGRGGDQAAAGPVDRRGDRGPVELARVVVGGFGLPGRLVPFQPGAVHPSWVED